jgi:hypothetical protein
MRVLCTHFQGNRIQFVWTTEVEVATLRQLGLSEQWGYPLMLIVENFGTHALRGTLDFGFFKSQFIILIYYFFFVPSFFLFFCVSI